MLPKRRSLIGKAVEVQVTERSRQEERPPVDRWAAGVEAVKNLHDYDFDAWTDQRNFDCAQSVSIWSEVDAIRSDVSLADWQKEELNRRKASLEANPQSGRSWDEVKAHARQTRPGSGETEPSETPP